MGLPRAALVLCCCVLAAGMPAPASALLGARCDLALAASGCKLTARKVCWDCLQQHASALKQAGCTGSALTSWCQYGTCSTGGAFANDGWCNATASLESRADALVAAATLSEKAGMLSATNAGIPRLGVPAFVYSECLHGLKVDCPAGDPSCSAVFPAPIALAVFALKISAFFQSTK